MTSPIDPIRRSARLGRARHPEAGQAEEAHAEDRLLPVPLEPSPSPPPPRMETKGEAVFAAQLLGQDGQKRGLRGGQEILDAAKNSYVRTEWSGAADRRAPRGRGTKTEA
jgi:hypothetical protein